MAGARNIFRRLPMIGAVLACLAVAGCESLRAPDLSERKAWKGPYPVRYAGVPPVIDGKLDDLAWKRAASWTTFYDLRQHGKVVDIGAAYLAWDKENLYFAMQIKDQDLYVTEKNDDSILCYADVAELFIKPRTDRLDLYEFEFNALNAVWYIHYISRGGGTDRRFTQPSHSGIRCRAAYEGTLNDWNDVDAGWTVEVAIPFSTFSRAVPGGPESQNVWKVNVAGFDYSCYRERILGFTSSRKTDKLFDEYEGYSDIRFEPPEMD